jgi:hypothetical protein
MILSVNASIFTNMVKQKTLHKAGFFVMILKC